MASDTQTNAPLALGFEGLDETLRGELTTFEVFFKTFGFKRSLGRVWGLLVLSGQALSSREIAAELTIQGAPLRCWMRAGRSGTRASRRARSSSPATDS